MIEFLDGCIDGPHFEQSPGVTKLAHQIGQRRLHGAQSIGEMFALNLIDITPTFAIDIAAVTRYFAAQSLDPVPSVRRIAAHLTLPALLPEPQLFQIEF